MKNDIKYKINKVCDCLCRTCGQHWRGECRAYQFPHNKYEESWRNRDRQGLCEIPVLRWGFEKVI